MRKTLLATTAAATVVGLTTLATAQTMEGEKGGARPQSVQQQPKGPAGGATTQQGGAQRGSAAAQEQGSKQQERIGQGAQEQNKPMQTGAQQEQRGSQQRGAEEQKSGVNVNDRNANQAPAGRGGSVQLSQDQRTKILGIIGHDRAARVGGDVHFNVAVGATVPRDVHVEVLPEDVVEIVPQYEGFDYVLVGDEILIVDPRTLEIVAIIPA
jgi:hypothetical protein